MVRHFFLWLLIALTPLQGLRAAEHDKVSLSTQVVADGVRHWLDHKLGVAHHHDDDGAVHHDDSQESHDHVEDHAGCQHADLPQIFAVFKAPSLIDAAPDSKASSAHPDPFLDKPPRPPHSLG